MKKCSVHCVSCLRMRESLTSPPSCYLATSISYVKGLQICVIFHIVCGERFRLAVASAAGRWRVAFIELSWSHLVPARRYCSTPTRGLGRRTQLNRHAAGNTFDSPPWTPDCIKWSVHARRVHHSSHLISFDLNSTDLIFWAIGRVSYIRIYLCYFCFRWKTVSLVQASLQYLMHHVTVSLQQKITLQNNCINNTSITQPTLSFYFWLKM